MLFDDWESLVDVVLIRVLSFHEVYTVKQIVSNGFRVFADKKDLSMLFQRAPDVTVIKKHDL